MATRLLAPVGVLLLAILTLFWPALRHPALILYPTFSEFSDVMVIHWPKAHLMAQQWQAGEGLAHWTPLILSGMPLAANQLAMLAYPPAWLLLVLPIEPVFNGLFVAHLLLGGVGVYVLLHYGFRLSSAAALIGGLAFALNGKWLAHIAGGHVSMVGAIGWMPWAVFGMHMLLQPPGEATRRRRGFGGAILIAVVLALQITTHTLLVIYTVYLLAGMVAWHLAVMTRPAAIFGEVVRLWLPLACIGPLAGLLGAAQALPLLELAGYSNRALTLAQAAEFSVTPLQLAFGLLLPSIQPGHELIIYLGLVPLLLLPLGVSRAQRWTWFYGLVFVFCVLFALGPATPVHALFYYGVPGFGWIRTPARMFLVGGLMVAILSGFAVAHLMTWRWSSKARRWLTRGGVVGGLLSLLLGVGLIFVVGQVDRATLGLVLFGTGGIVLILLRVRNLMPGRTFALLVGGLLFLDLASFGMTLFRFVPLEVALSPGRPAAEFLAAQTQNQEPFRVYSPSYSLPTQTAAAYNLQLADGVEPVHLSIYDEYMARAGGYGDASFSVTIPNFGEGPLDSALRDTEPNLKLLGLLNVRYLASEFPMAWEGLTFYTQVGSTYIYTNTHALPRAWMATRAIPQSEDWLTQLATLPDLEAVVLVADATANDMSAEGTVNVTHYAADRIVLDVTLDSAGWLVLSEIWYPGWEVVVNDTVLPMQRVNGLLRGVYLDQTGQYTVTVRYRPASVIWGAWISGLTVLALIGIAGWRWRNNPPQ